MNHPDAQRAISKNDTDIEILSFGREIDTSTPTPKLTRRRLALALGEYELLVALLEDALHCYFKHIQATSRSGKKLFAESEHWFFDGKDRSVFSFDNVCGYLDLDPDFVRRGLKLYNTAHGYTSRF